MEWKLGFKKEARKKSQETREDWKENRTSLFSALSSLFLFRITHFSCKFVGMK